MFLTWLIAHPVLITAINTFTESAGLCGLLGCCPRLRGHVDGCDRSIPASPQQSSRPMPRRI